MVLKAGRSRIDVCAKHLAEGKVPCRCPDVMAVDVHNNIININDVMAGGRACLLYTSDAADDVSWV